MGSIDVQEFVAVEERVTEVGQSLPVGTVR
jgi:hypothetical protein